MRTVHVSIYIRVLLYSLASALTAYLHSSFLQTISLTSSAIDLVYIAVSIIGVISVWWLALGKRSIHTYQMLILGALAIIVLSLSAVVFSSSVTVLLSALILFLALDSPMFFMFDELLEKVSLNISTGRTRSFYLLAQNSVWIIAPLIGMVFIGGFLQNGFELLYAASLVAALIVFCIQFITLIYHDHDTEPRSVPSNRFNKRAIPAIVSHCLLHLSYVVSVIITPLYLHTELHWEWSTIGYITAVSLLVFPLVQLPLGKLLDKDTTEYRHMIIGIVTMAIAVFYFAQSNAITPLLAICILCLIRGGSAIVEISNESNMFKTVTTNDRSTMALFRTCSPLMYLSAPLLFFISSRFGFPIVYIGLSIVLILGAGCVYLLQQKFGGE
jgi:hypothetical protein